MARIPMDLLLHRTLGNAWALSFLACLGHTVVVLQVVQVTHVTTKLEEAPNGVNVSAALFRWQAAGSHRPVL